LPYLHSQRQVALRLGPVTRMVREGQRGSGDIKRNGPRDSLDRESSRGPGGALGGRELQGGPFQPASHGRPLPGFPVVPALSPLLNDLKE
jgi:hypothetical protein